MMKTVIAFATPTTFRTNSIHSTSTVCPHRYASTRWRPSNHQRNNAVKFTVTASASVVSSANDTTIRLMACDMDGTLLTTDKKVSSVNEDTILRLMEETDIIFIPATGKSRAGVLKSLEPKISQKIHEKYSNGCPGVFLQGLLVFNLQGQIVYERTLDFSIIEQCSKIAKDLNVDLIAYNRDNILCEQTSSFTDLLPVYHEPEPQVISSWEQFAVENSINKMIFMAEPNVIDAIRPGIQNQLGEFANLTQAQDNMLEILPKNTNKGFGVKQLLNDLNLNASQVLAIGDAENDIELLKMVEYSCVVDNALPSVKAVAKYQNFGTNDQNGVSNAILNFFF